MTVVAAAIDRHSSPSSKVVLFRSLFRGRSDVYPRRFDSRKTGKSGYAPACANEWVRGICEKPRIKCAVCTHRRFLPVTDEVIHWHLSGRDAQDQPFAAGVYPTTGTVVPDGAERRVGVRSLPYFASKELRLALGVALSLRTGLRPVS